MPLGTLPRLLVLIVEREEESRDLDSWSSGCPERWLSRHLGGEVADVRSRIVVVRTELIDVPFVRPASLSDRDHHVVEPQLLHREVDGIKHLIKKISVDQPTIRINVGQIPFLQQSIINADVGGILGPREERVDIEKEERFSPVQEFDQRCDHLNRDVGPEPPARGREARLQHVHRDRSPDFDVVDGVLVEGPLDVPHGGNEV